MFYWVALVYKLFITYKTASNSYFNSIEYTVKDLINQAIQFPFLLIFISLYGFRYIFIPFGDLFDSGKGFAIPFLRNKDTNVSFYRFGLIRATIYYPAMFGTVLFMNLLTKTILNYDFLAVTNPLHYLAIFFYVTIYFSLIDTLVYKYIVSHNMHRT